MAKSQQFELNQEDWQSVLRGAIKNLVGTALLTFGMFLGTISNEGTFNWLALKIALATNLSTVIVNIVTKYFSAPPKS